LHDQWGAVAVITREYDFGRPLHTFNLSPRATDYVLTVARDWQSPGSIGRELATLASMRVVTDELGDDISKTIRNLRAMAKVDPRQAVELAMNIADLKLVADALQLELDEDVK
jgi:hypothetical protein